MSQLAGAVLPRIPGPKYAAALRFVELDLQSPLPKHRTLASWRAALPADFRLALRVPKAAWHPTSGPLRPGAELDEGLRWLSSAAEGLAADLLVVVTGPEVTTGRRDRDRLSEYFARLPRVDQRIVVWKPRGLWEPSAVQDLASTLSVVGGFDPLDDPAPSGRLRYGSLSAEGFRQSFSPSQLQEVAHKMRGAEHAFVSISSPRSFEEARLLQSIFDEST